MIGRFLFGALKVVLVLIVLTVIAAALFWYRPWAPHEPGRWFLAMFPEKRAEYFSTWERLTPYQDIHASAQPRAYQRAPQDLGTLNFSSQGEEKSLSTYLEDHAVTGLMVVDDGTIAFEHFDQGVGPETNYHIWSASKSYTSTLIAIALKQGKIKSLDDTVETYAQQFAGTAYGETTIRNLLMMSSGVAFRHHNHEPDRNDMYFAIILRGEDLDVWAADLGRRVPQGTDFNYLATDTHVLGAVLRAVYDQPLGEIITEQLWQPFGFSSDAIWSENAAGAEQNVFAHCCIAPTLQDFAHLGQIYLDGLELGEELVVPDGWLDDVARPQEPFQTPQVDPETGDVSLGYSYQFWLPPEGQDEFIALGAFGQYLWIDRRRRFVVAQFSITDPSPNEYVAAMRAIGDRIVAERS